MPSSKNLKHLPLGQDVSYFLNFMWVNTVYIYDMFLRPSHSNILQKINILAKTCYTI